MSAAAQHLWSLAGFLDSSPPALAAMKNNVQRVQRELAENFATRVRSLCESASDSVLTDWTTWLGCPQAYSPEIFHLYGSSRQHTDLVSSDQDYQFQLCAAGVSPDGKVKEGEGEARFVNVTVAGHGGVPTPVLRALAMCFGEAATQAASNLHSDGFGLRLRDHDVKWKMVATFILPNGAEVDILPMLRISGGNRVLLCPNGNLLLGSALQNDPDWIGQGLTGEAAKLMIRAVKLALRLPPSIKDRLRRAAEAEKKRRAAPEAEDKQQAAAAAAAGPDEETSKEKKKMKKLPTPKIDSFVIDAAVAVLCDPTSNIFQQNGYKFAPIFAAVLDKLITHLQPGSAAEAAAPLCLPGTKFPVLTKIWFETEKERENWHETVVELLIDIRDKYTKPCASCPNGDPNEHLLAFLRWKVMTTFERGEVLGKPHPRPQIGEQRVIGSAEMPLHANESELVLDIGEGAVRVSLSLNLEKLSSVRRGKRRWTRVPRARLLCQQLCLPYPCVAMVVEFENLVVGNEELHAVVNNPDICSAFEIAIDIDRLKAHGEHQPWVWEVVQRLEAVRTWPADAQELPGQWQQVGPPTAPTAGPLLDGRLRWQAEGPAKSDSAAAAAAAGGGGGDHDAGAASAAAGTTSAPMPPPTGMDTTDDGGAKAPPRSPTPTLPTPVGIGGSADQSASKRHAADPSGVQKEQPAPPAAAAAALHAQPAEAILGRLMAFAREAADEAKAPMHGVAISSKLRDTYRELWMVGNTAMIVYNVLYDLPREALKKVMLNRASEEDYRAADAEKTYHIWGDKLIGVYNELKTQLFPLYETFLENNCAVPEAVLDSLLDRVKQFHADLHKELGQCATYLAQRDLPLWADDVETTVRRKCSKAPSILETAHEVKTFGCVTYRDELDIHVMVPFEHALASYFAIPFADIAGGKRKSVQTVYGVTSQLAHEVMMAYWQLYLVPDLSLAALEDGSSSSPSDEVISAAAAEYSLAGDTIRDIFREILELMCNMYEDYCVAGDDLFTAERLKTIESERERLRTVFWHCRDIASNKLRQQSLPHGTPASHDCSIVRSARPKLILTDAHNANVYTGIRYDDGQNPPFYHAVASYFKTAWNYIEEQRNKVEKYNEWQAYGRLWTVANDTMRSVETLRCMRRKAEEMVEKGTAAELDKRIVAAEEFYKQAAVEVEYVLKRIWARMETLFQAYRDGHGTVPPSEYEDCVKVARELNNEHRSTLARVSRDLQIKHNVPASLTRCSDEAKTVCSKPNPGWNKAHTQPDLWKGYNYLAGESFKPVSFSDAISSHFQVPFSMLKAEGQATAKPPTSATSSPTAPVAGGGKQLQLRPQLAVLRVLEKAYDKYVTDAGPELQQLLIEMDSRRGGTYYTSLLQNFATPKTFAAKFWSELSTKTDPVLGPAPEQLLRESLSALGFEHLRAELYDYVEPSPPDADHVDSSAAAANAAAAAAGTTAPSPPSRFACGLASMKSDARAIIRNDEVFKASCWRWTPGSTIYYHVNIGNDESNKLVSALLDKAGNKWSEACTVTFAEADSREKAAFVVERQGPMSAEKGRLFAKSFFPEDVYRNRGSKDWKGTLEISDDFFNLQQVLKSEYSVERGPDGVQVVQIAILVHELGHILGLQHEIKMAEIDDSALLSRLQGTAFDKESIMMADVAKLRAETVDSTLSSGDKRAIRIICGCAAMKGDANSGSASSDSNVLAVERYSDA